ncbi:MAG: ABC transporter permease [Clostridiales bacterium]|nr:ABC transporter permease [Clostridiales bacterium]
MKDIGKKISLMPVHAIIMCLASIFSFAAIFIPMFDVVVQYKHQRVYSLLTMLTAPHISATLMSGQQVELDFLQFGVIVFVSTIVIAVAAVTLSLSYQLFVDNRNKKRIGCLITMALFIVRLVIHIITASRFITDEMLKANEMTHDRLYAAQTFMGNALVLVLIIGIIASLYGALGLKMNYKLFAYPYILWIVVFTVLPLLLILFRAFFKSTGAGYEFTTAGFEVLFENKTVTATFYGQSLVLQEYFSVFLRSLDYAVWTTIGCLVVAYPLAYILARRARSLHQSGSRLLLLFVLPMWMNTMLRTYAWRAFFSETGVLNTILANMNLINEPVLFLKNEILADIITKLVMTNDFLPYMILPIYSVLIKIEPSLLEASYDLGAGKAMTFLKVTLPLSLPGVISGIQMVFMPSLTFYMIPDIITEGSKTTVGNTIQSFVLNESSTLNQAGNVLSLLLLIFVLITMGILRNSDKEAEGGGMMTL